MASPIRLIFYIPSHRIPEALRHLRWFKGGGTVYGVEVYSERDLCLLYETPGLLIDELLLARCCFHELTELLLA